MAWYDKFIHAVRDELGPRPLRLLSLIFELASRDRSDALTYRCDKKPVLGRLAENEGTAPSAEVVRARIHQINQAIRAIRPGDPAFEVKSRKAGFEVKLREGVEDELARQEAGRLAERSSDADAIADASEYIEPAVFTGPREFQVFVSHAHESEEVEKIVRAFVEDLGRKLANPPPRYKDLLRITLWLDHDHMGGARSFADQAHPECERSELALFLLSDRFYLSKNCQAEAQFFSAEPGAAPRHIQVQLSGNFNDAEDYFRDKPCYPQLWRSSIGTLLRAWELGPADRDEFLTRLRDDILAEIFRRNFPDGPDGKSSPKTPARADAKARAKEADIAAELLRSAGGTRFEDVIDREKTEPPAITREEGSAETESAVDLLADWACSDASVNRVFALLGSFGAGKTTTSQLFVRELLRRRENGSGKTPVPVYLDLRRLNEIYLDEKTRPSLAEMIRSSLRSDVRDQIDADQLLEFLRREPCVIVFDGLDEIGTRIGLERLASLYRELLEIVPNKVWERDAKAGAANWADCPARILITCRTHFFRTHVEQQSTLADRDRHRGIKAGAEGGLVRTIYMAPFTPEQIRSYFLNELGEVEGEAVWQSVSRIGDLHGLATRPIMARYIAELSPQLHQDLARGRAINAARVYDHLFEKAVERDNDKKPLLKPRDRARLLEELAEELWLSRQPSLSIDALEDWFDRYCEAAPGLRLVASSKPEARGLLQTELRNANLLVRAGDREFGFVHTSFQEYFLARKLKERLDAAALPDLPEARTPSRETLHFLLDLYAVEKTWLELRAALDRSLAPGAPIFWRQFAMDVREVMAQRDQWFALPEAADLSGLDLREMAWPRQRLARVDLRGANLLGSEFIEIEFDRCLLDNSNWANTAADACSFRDCDGQPEGLASAQFGGCAVQGTSIENFGQLLFSAPSSLVENGTGFEKGPFQRFVFDGAGRLNSAIFGAGDRTILTAGDDDTARLWDAASGAELCRFEGHAGAVFSAVFGADGRTILTAGDDGTARLWDATGGAELRRFEGHGGAVFSAAASLDGQAILTAGHDGTARLWDAANGAALRTFEGHVGRVTSAVFGAGDRTILTAGDDSTARLWDAASGEELRRFEGFVGGINGAVFGADGETIVTSGDDGTARLWGVASGEELRRFEGSGGFVRSAVPGAHGRTILTTGDSGVRLWDATSGQELRRFDGHGGAVNSAVFGADDRTILTAGYDGTVRLWDVASGMERCRFEGHRRVIKSALFGVDGRTILTAGYDGTARLLDAVSGAELRRFEGHGGAVLSAVFGADGRTILTTVSDGTALLWDAATGKELRRLEEQSGGVNSAVFSADGKTILTAGEDGTARLWNAASGEELRRFEGHVGAVTAAVFGAADRTILTAGFDGTARLWDAASAAELCRFEGHSGATTSASFSADGRTILTAVSDGTARLWDAASGEELRLFHVHESWVNSAVFGAGDQTILTAGDDGTARLWDVASGEELSRFEGHGAWVRSAVFGADDKTILTAGNDGSVRLWDVASGDLLYALRPLPDAWARLDRDRRVVAGGGKLWKYVYGLATDADGSRRVVNPW